jgi:uncharacterized membrane protein
MKPDTSTPKRSIAKGVSFETVSNLAGFGIAYLMFGNFGSCAAYTAVCFVVKLLLFYEHERIWHQIPFGKKP